MKFPSTLALAAAIALAVPTAAHAQDASAAAAESVEIQLAQEIIENGFPPETRMGMFDDVIDQLLGQMRASLPNIQDDPRRAAVFDRHAERVRATSMEVLSDHIDAIMDSLVVAYADQFNEAELRGLHEFIMTPEGHGFLARTAEVNGHPAFAAANQAYMQDYFSRMPQLIEQLQADIAKIGSD